MVFSNSECLTRNDVSFLASSGKPSFYSHCFSGKYTIKKEGSTKCWSNQFFSYVPATLAGRQWWAWDTSAPQRKYSHLLLDFLCANLNSQAEAFAKKWYLLPYTIIELRIFLTVSWKYYNLAYILTFNYLVFCNFTSHRFSTKLDIPVEDLQKAGWDIRSAALTDELEPQGLGQADLSCLSPSDVSALYHQVRRHQRMGSMRWRGYST